MISNGDSANVSSINQGRSTIFMRGNFFEVKKFSEGATSANTIGLAWQRSSTGVATLSLDHRTVCVAVRVTSSGRYSRSDILQMLRIL